MSEPKHLRRCAEFHAKLAPVGNYKAGSMTSSIIENCGGSMSNGIFGGRVLCICFFDVV